MLRQLESLGTIPVTSSVLGSYFPNIESKNNKISELEKVGVCSRLKKGLFVLSPEVSRQPLSTELIANHLYVPSYISMHSALRYYGLIPEEVFTIQSMTIKHSRAFENTIGRFEYIHTSREAYPVGITNVATAQYSFLIATPEKALCDLVATTPMLNLRYRQETKDYLFENLRIDEDDFYQMRPEIFKEYAAVGKKAGSINTIIQLLEQ